MCDSGKKHTLGLLGAAGMAGRPGWRGRAGTVGRPIGTADRLAGATDPAARPPSILEAECHVTRPGRARAAAAGEAVGRGRRTRVLLTQAGEGAGLGL